MLTLSSIAPISPQIAVCDSDSQMIDLWLSGKSANTQQAYRRDIDLFLAFIEGKPLQRVTLNDFQAYRQAIESQGWAESSVRRRLNAVKSLITFGHTIGVLAVNAAKPERIGKGKEKISQRILPESAILKMLHSYQGKQRDRAILKFLYASGCRCSEAIGLKWEDCQELDSGNCRVTVHGKGSKTRVILLNGEVWQ
ncbi:MAG TPA: site-specific integrase, partial [Allocoleopsis sp.]